MCPDSDECSSRAIRIKQDNFAGCLSGRVHTGTVAGAVCFGKAAPPPAFLRRSTGYVSGLHSGVAPVFAAHKEVLCCMVASLKGG